MNGQFQFSSDVYPFAIMEHVTYQVIDQRTQKVLVTGTDKEAVKAFHSLRKQEFYEGSVGKAMLAEQARQDENTRRRKVFDEAQGTTQTPEQSEESARLYRFRKWAYGCDDYRFLVIDRQYAIERLGSSVQIFNTSTGNASELYPYPKGLKDAKKMGDGGGAVDNRGYGKCST